MDKPLRYYELHAEVCKTFGHPKRLMVITTLRNNELTVTEIAEETKIDVSNLSQHLHVLRDKGIVTTRREGTKIFYRLSHPNIGKALDLMSSFLEQRITSSHDLIKEQ
ncbi:MAG: metalloregulator ArsR/SmtB family transcription factor [Candidatus Aminicenantes bacterium]|jgi:ArsR family transcriptional regulator